MKKYFSIWFALLGLACLMFSFYPLQSPPPVVALPSETFAVTDSLWTLSQRIVPIVGFCTACNAWAIAYFLWPRTE